MSVKEKAKMFAAPPSPKKTVIFCKKTNSFIRTVVSNVPSTGRTTITQINKTNSVLKKPLELKNISLQKSQKATSQMYVGILLSTVIKNTTDQNSVLLSVKDKAKMFCKNAETVNLPTNLAKPWRFNNTSKTGESTCANTVVNTVLRPVLPGGSFINNV